MIGGTCFWKPEWLTLKVMKIESELYPHEPIIEKDVSMFGRASNLYAACGVL